MRRLSVAALLSLAVLCVGSSVAALPRVLAGQPDVRDTVAKEKKKPRITAPKLVSPADGQTGDAIPAFGWRAVRGAPKYEFQLSADRTFSSTIYTIQTLNTFATVDKSLTDGTYYWRVRSIDGQDVAGLWSQPRSYTKSWAAAPVLLGPAGGQGIVYPSTPLVLSWSPVRHAYKYLVYVATDPSLGSLAPGFGNKPVETSGTRFALPGALAPGRYYWAVTPEDAEKHTGQRSVVSSFDWSWPTATATNVADASGAHISDGSGLTEVLSPELSWGPIAGAAQYQVEINPAQDFAPGSKVCCTDLTTGASLSPVHYLPNNVYYWRVRAVDINGNAGVWNQGPTFRKAFDDQTPSIAGLSLRDPGTPGDDQLPVGSTTSAPLITWNPVVGASKYEVDIAPYDSTVLHDCDWSLKTPFFTASSAWTPLGGSSGRPQPTGWPFASTDGSKKLGAGSYCARVIGISDRDQTGKDIITVPTLLGGPGQPGFAFAPSSLPGNPGLDFTQSSDYLSMQTGSATGAMPVLRWTPIAGAQSYYVVVAKDAAFTKVIDYALTNVPAYAPRTGGTPIRTYTDETTHYYWQVMPAASSNGTTCHCDISTDGNHAQSFDKNSSPPGLLAPGAGTNVTEQPVFRWTSAEGARSYELQVSQDQSFGTLIDDVKTDSVSFTSSTTYPADTTLYWRVRANHENNEGLNWSSTGTFVRTLATPALDSSNPLFGPDIPVVKWDPVSGATSYTLHVEQGDGTTRDFTASSPAFTPSGFYGVGKVRWQVRANFPKTGPGETFGPYSGFQAFTRQIDAPTGVRWVGSPRHVLLSWDPSPNIGTKQYKIQISTTNSFSTTVDSHTTENTSYAPLLTQKGFKDGGTLYWRVATLDEHGTLGAWTSRTLTLPGRMRIRLGGSLRAHARGAVRVRLTNIRGRAIRGGKVRVTGVGFRTVAKRTGRRGTVTFRLRPGRTGKLTFQGSKSGYQSASATLRVR
jgi:hypothetical protein